MLKNIIIITESFVVGGGASEVAIKTVKLLAALKQFNVFLMATGTIPDESNRISDVTYMPLPALRQNNEKNIVKGFVNKLYNFDVEKKLFSYLKEFPCDETVVHVHNWPIFSYSLFSALIKWNGKFCVTMHDYYAFCPSNNFFNYNQWKICQKKPGSIDCFCTNCERRNFLYKFNQDVRFLFQNYFFNFYKKIKNLIFVSDFSRQKMEMFFVNRDNVVTINNPVSFVDYTPVTRNEKYLFVGRLSKEKGAELFCKAISDLGLKGVVAGDGVELDMLKKKYSSIEYLGWCNRETVQSLYQQCKALVFPTLLYETAGLSVLEALSFDLPCIIPDKAAASCYVEDMKTSLLFESGDVESLKKSILLMEDDRVRLSLERNIKDTFKRNDFSDDQYVENIIAFYNKILC